MCGIAGIITRQTPQQIAPRLHAMVQCMSHRGPDDHGCAIIGFGPNTLALGHRRLSIIDLSPLGHQPMVNEATGDTIIFNGEIYNFQSLRTELEAEGVRFNGHSDTEVLLYGLAMRGPGFIDQLQGMYALAFHNKRENTLLLARDPLGIKPLYVARTKNALIFGSEIRTLLASEEIERKLDRQALASLLAFGAVQWPSTIVQGIREFPAGHWQIIKPDALDREPAAPIKYWDYRAPSPITESDAVSRVRTTLDDAVRDHLISDVPVGVFLSSGLDSTIVAGLAAKHVDRLRTFTVGFEEHSDLSESTLAKQTAAEFGVNHTEINVTGPTALELCQQWLLQQDQPSLDGLNVYIISKVVREAGITVALSGQGGDEMFCGYSSFHDVPVMQRWLRLASMMPGSLRRLAATFAGVPKPRFMKDKFLDLASSSTDILALYLHRRRALSNRQLDLMGVRASSLGMTANYLLPDAEAAATLHPSDVLWNISQLESRFYMGNMLLRDGDGNSMAHSLEIRVPFLDRRVIDLATSIPGSVRWPAGKPKKHLLREAFPNLLRPALAQQGKRGFEIPVKRWMQGPLRELAVHALDQLRSSGAVRSEGIDDIWQTYQREPETPIWSRAWLLVSLGTYIERHGLS